MASNAFRTAIESLDIKALEQLLAPDVRFHSPVMVHPYQGRHEVASFIGNLSEVFQDFRYTHELSDDAPGPGEYTQALFFAARIGRKPLQGVDLLTYDASGLVADLTVMVRPLPAAMTLARTVGARVEAGGEAGDAERLAGDGR